MRLALPVSCYDVTTIRKTELTVVTPGVVARTKGGISSAEKPSPEKMSLLRDCRYKGRRYKEHLLYVHDLIVCWT